MRQLILMLFCCCAVAGLAQKPDQSLKISPSLHSFIQQKQKRTDSVDLIISVADIGIFKIQNRDKVRIIKEYASTNSFVVSVPVIELDKLLDQEAVVFADLHRIPIEELTTGGFDLTVNHIKLAHHQYPLVNGKNVLISIKEQKFDTTDIDFKGRYINTGVASNGMNDHASIIATMIAGGGNTSPFAKGAAWSANISSSDFSSLLPDHDSIYQRNSITVQNHSYGTGIENYYGADAVAYDMTVNKTPSLLHVFSSGNSGTASPNAGSYTGVTGFANLTGSFKMSKNSLVVGAIDSMRNIVPYSSKGPAYDGRVKPELVAFGYDGTSGAAAIVSGVVALMQDAYKELHSDSLPSAALVKAILINTAEDAGSPNIDYTTGYGSLDAAAAIKAVKNHSFLEESVVEGETKTFDLDVPVNSKKIKLSVVWTDTIATVNASKALVNDLNSVLKFESTGETWLPWVLSSKPHVDSLNAVALRKTDTLNNVEQISIDNPAPGNYKISVSGVEVINKQKFAIAYAIETNDRFEWSYPTGSDAILNDRRTILRWKTNMNGTANASYAINGSNFINAGTVDLNDKYYSWVPPLAEGKVVFRLTQGIKEFYSDTFVLSRPIDIKVGFNCPDSFLLYWNETNADNYQVYRLGEKYMQPIVVSADTIEVFHKSAHPQLYYAVAPIAGNKYGFRSYTINYTTQAVDCYFKSFLALLNNSNGDLRLELGTIYDVDSVSFIKLSNNGSYVLQTVIPMNGSIFYTDQQLQQGANRYRVIVHLKGGQKLVSNIEQIYYLPNDPVIVYPNPARQHEPINILASEIFVYSVSIFDASGKEVHRQELQNQVESIKPFQLSKGLYFIRITNNEGVSFTRKLIVQ